MKGLYNIYGRVIDKINDRHNFDDNILSSACFDLTSNARYEQNKVKYMQQFISILQLTLILINHVPSWRPKGYFKQ